MGRGGWVIDVRPVAGFAAGHIPGTVPIPLREQFATWLGWLIPDGVPPGFVPAPGQDPAEVTWQALKIGYENPAGGMAAWQADGRPAERTGLVTAGRMGGRAVLDVRQAAEYAAGHVPGAVHAEPGDLPARARDAPAGAVVMCGHGESAPADDHHPVGDLPDLPQHVGRVQYRAAGAGVAAQQPAQPRDPRQVQPVRRLVQD
jgi:hydroxyacylglutathione hydrolase